MNRLKGSVLFVLFMLVLSACGPTGPAPVTPVTAGTPVPVTPAPGGELAEPTLSVLERYYVPAYYSPFYAQIVEDSKSENGLLIYSSADSKNWLPVVRTFREHYPWIEVIVFPLEPGKVFERYFNEYTGQLRTADIVVSSDLLGWQEFIEKGEVLSYRSAEDAYLPSWARTGFGIYALSSDPLLLIYNKSALSSTAPESMQDLVVMTDAFEEYYRGRVIAHDVASSRNGLVLNWFWLNARGETGWNILRALSRVKPMFSDSDQQMAQAVGTGDARLGYFVSSAAVLPAQAQYPNLSWSYLRDGQPIQVTSIAITRANRSPNSAKLMMDFLLSQEGQLALSLGGLTPYRTDIAQVSELHIEKVSAEVGQENLIFIVPDPGLRDQQALNALLLRWQSVFGQPAPAAAETNDSPAVEPAPTPGN
jgi:iron(III) transport system substrate-binding protein